MSEIKKGDRVIVSEEGKEPYEGIVTGVIEADEGYVMGNHYWHDELYYVNDKPFLSQKLTKIE